jgi:hypothetical protein
MFNPYLGLSGLPSFPDLDAIPTPPPIASGFEARCECYWYLHQFSDIVFFHTPQCFHEHGIWLYP